MTIGIWRWVQLMYDVSANPWEMRYKPESQAVVANTGAASASNLNPGLVALGETGGVGEATTQYFGHVKIGIAANDDDWWDTPSGAQPSARWLSAVGW